MSGAYRYKFHYVPSWWKDRMSYIATPKYDIDKSDEDHPIKQKEDPYEGNIYNKRDRDGTPQPYTLMAAKAQSDYVRLVVDLAYMPKKGYNSLLKNGGVTTDALIQ